MYTAVVVAFGLLVIEKPAWRFGPTHAWEQPGSDGSGAGCRTQFFIADPFCSSSLYYSLPFPPPYK